MSNNGIQQLIKGNWKQLNWINICNHLWSIGFIQINYENAKYLILSNWPNLNYLSMCSHFYIQSRNQIIIVVNRTFAN